MKNKGLIVGLIASVSLIGCGGGGGGSSTPSSVSSFSGSGIYVNTADLAVMVVDSSRSANNLVVGDFANNGVYFTDLHWIECPVGHQCIKAVYCR